jgi:lysophospholipase L1-like esterase
VNPAPLTRKIVAALLGLLATSLLLEIGLGFFPALLRAPVRGGADGGVRILCLGNSYTAGVGATPGHGYCEELERLLRADARWGKLNPRVVNLGFPGRNSTEVLRALPAQVQEYRPELALLMTGEPNAWNEEGYQAFLARGAREPLGIAARVADWWQRRHVVRLVKLLVNGTSIDADARIFPDISLNDTRALGFAWFGYLYPRSEKGDWPKLSEAQWHEALAALTSLYDLTSKYHQIVPLLIGKVLREHKFTNIPQHQTERDAIEWFERSNDAPVSSPTFEFVEDRTLEMDILDSGIPELRRKSKESKLYPAILRGERLRLSGNLYTSSDYAAALLARPADATLLEGHFNALLAENKLKEALEALKQNEKWNPFGFRSGLLDQAHALFTAATKNHRPDIIEATNKALEEFKKDFPNELDFHATTPNKSLEKWVTSDIAEIATYLRSQNVQPLLQTYPPKHNGLDRGENRAIKQAASDLKLPLVDLEEILKRLPKEKLESLYSTAGGPKDDHLNDEGYKLVAESLFDTIRALPALP